MENALIQGAVHSIQTLGTLDGPGVRFVVFLQGCPLRCGCCHNPDTQSREGGTIHTAEELCARAKRYRVYFGKDGGVTLSGGEPLLQPVFAAEFFRLCKEEGIHTCLDTSGCILNGEIAALLECTDRVLLDVKYPTEEQYRAHVGCSMAAPMTFLEELNRRGIPTTLRQVTIPTLNDTKASVTYLVELARRYPCVDKVELLPFKKICQVKYDKMGIPFPFAHIPEPTPAKMQALQSLLGDLA
jgi:pyruvate formate lyase activating enzyme